MSRRTTRRNYTEKVQEEHEQADDEIEDEELEVTRCVCGNDDLNSDEINESLANLLLTEYDITIDQGLFIQCEKCSVWQHGYCVGLFTNEDVPDKYWCEVCKPDLHVVIHEGNDKIRTLYKPVNDKRKKLMSESEKSSKRKFTRKDRRNYDFDEQLQKALRESAKESGIELADKNKVEPKKETPKEEPAEPTEAVKEDVNPPQEEDAPAAEIVNETGGYEDDEPGAEAEAEGEEDEESPEIKKKAVKRPRKKDNRGKTKKPKSDSKPDTPTFTKEELIKQPSKARFVNENSSIYELRKRISAILEWLNRSQLELEDEKLTKLTMTNDPELINNFNENLVSMQGLTTKILEWEEKFGKYAP